MANKKINELTGATDLALTDLMASGDPGTGLLKKVTVQQVANAIIGVIGGAYETYTGIAGENLGGGKLVYLNAGKFYLYNANDTALADAAFGITQAAAVADAAVTIQLSGVFTEVGMGLTPGTEYYADINGLFTTTPTAVVSTFIGIAITADSLKLNIQQSIITI
jgi:hypothetical protein